MYFGRKMFNLFANGLNFGDKLLSVLSFLMTNINSCYFGVSVSVSVCVDNLSVM